MGHDKGKKPSHPDMEVSLEPNAEERPRGPCFRQITVSDAGLFRRRPRFQKVTERDPPVNKHQKNKLKSFLVGLADQHFKDLMNMCNVNKKKIGRVRRRMPLPMSLDDNNSFDHEALAMSIDAGLYAIQKDLEDLPPMHRLLARKKQKLAMNSRAKAGLPVSDITLDATDHVPDLVTETKPPEKMTKARKHARTKKCARAKSSAEATVQTKVLSTLDSPSTSLECPTASKPLDMRGLSEALPVASAKEKLDLGIDILIKVRIYKPFDHEKYKNDPDLALSDLFYHDLVLTGRHKVSDIMERFICSEKRGNSKEKPSFMLIQNSYFLDQDEDEDVDSLPGWVAERNLDDFPIYDMNNSRLDQIDFKLGNPDLYVHDGSCEHLLIFSEVRLLTAKDARYKSNYPLITTVSHNVKDAFCYCCSSTNPKWVVSDCSRVSYDRALMCETCVKNLLYGENGKKNCRFKAYPYKGMNAVRSN